MSLHIIDYISYHSKYCFGFFFSKNIAIFSFWPFSNKIVLLRLCIAPIQGGNWTSPLACKNTISWSDLLQLRVFLTCMPTILLINYYVCTLDHFQRKSIGCVHNFFRCDFKHSCFIIHARLIFYFNSYFCGHLGNLLIMLTRNITVTMSMNLLGYPTYVLDTKVYFLCHLL